MAKQIIESEISVIVYDDSKVSQIKAPMFDAVYWRGRATSSGQQGGRGSVLFVRHEERDWAIRHYYRGGMIGKLLTDQFFWTGQDDTRSFREWHLLQALQRDGLPAPAPVAARYQRSGLLYTADLITEKLPDVESLASRFL
ncbi:MAG: 3-deoxy-D-manno-octulosonic acid kinase, partial [Gammaproteobacteria bacterium]|nr:3-deoxy-D-manno-octulosonic acid kinase [Gammaproteobacteria bacterium]